MSPKIGDGSDNLIGGAMENKGDTVTGKCANCEKRFTYKFNTRPKKFCSDACRLDYYRKSQLLCEFCGEQHNRKEAVGKILPSDMPHPVSCCESCQGILEACDMLSKPMGEQFQAILDNLVRDHSLDLTFADWYLENVPHSETNEVRRHVMAQQQSRLKAERKFAYMTVVRKDRGE